jgi:hypothetical protein
MCVARGAQHGLAPSFVTKRRRVVNPRLRGLGYVGWSQKRSRMYQVVS